MANIASGSRVVTVDKLKIFKGELPAYLTGSGGLVGKESQTEVDNAQDSRISAVESAVKAVKSGMFVPVSSLPEPCKAEYTGSIYLIPASGGVDPDTKIEYIAIQDGLNWKWEKLGNTKADLSDYYKKSEIDSQHATITGSFNTALAEALNKIATEEDDRKSADSALSLRIGSLESGSANSVVGVEYVGQSLVVDKVANLTQITASDADIRSIFSL